MSTAPYFFEHDGLELCGHSLAGEESYVVLPQLNVAFDFGRAPREVVATEHVFLTHGHMDHAAGVAYYCSQRMFIDNPPGHVYAPEPLIEPLRRLLRVWADIDGTEPPAHLHAAIPGVDLEVRRDLIVRPFEVSHTCRGRDGRRFLALGFTLIEVRRKLKDEFQGLMGPQIVALKGQGIEVTRRVELPLVTYCGDTGVGPFLDLDFVRTSKILLLECTFIEAEHRERARAGNHIHVQDLREVYPKLANERIVLTHLTRRTMLSEARKALREVLGEEALGRVSFLAEHRRRKRPTPLAANSPERPNAPAANAE
jgi:ribonuclease Z